MFEQGHWRFLRGTRRAAGRNDTEYLRNSRANEARLNAAIEELDASRGTLTSMSELQSGLRDLASCYLESGIKR